jgi:CMP/dCMP kinase
LAVDKIMNQWVITLDGTSGCGKSTLAFRLAKNLARKMENVDGNRAITGQLLDTGAMYRAMGLALKMMLKPESSVLQEKVNLAEWNQKILPYLQDFSLESEVNALGETVISLIRAERPTLGPWNKELRAHDVTTWASFFSQFPSVREMLVQWQQDIVKKAQEKKIITVAEGRDMATVVFPKAFCQFFLTADVRIRAERRLAQLKNQYAEAAENIPSLEQLMKDISDRDERDQNRERSPLRAAPKAILINTSTLSLEEIEDVMWGHITQAIKNLL